MNTINNNNKKDDIKTDDDEIYNVDHNYIDDEYKELISNIFKFELGDGCLHLMEFDNRKLAVTNIVGNYLVIKILI